MWLALESSCDESALALMSDDGELVGEWLESQIDIHATYGGVVPDIAVGEHLNKFIPLLNLALRDFDLPNLVDKVAVTCGPGLVGCLGIGISFAKSLGLLWDIPVYGVNHLLGHAFSVFMPQVSERKDGLNDFLPHVGLLVSGGNTVLFIIDLNLEIRILAETVDDAAGEALDKGAKLLGIPYPGGAKMEEMALLGNSAIFDFPKAFPKKEDLRFSFSGLKTSLLYRIQGMTEREIEDSRNDLCACYQSAVVEQLVRKTSQVCADHDFRSFGLSGGVANNDLLRKKIEDFCLTQKTLFLPAAKKHTGDNAAMIAFAATVHPEGLIPNVHQNLSFSPGLRLTGNVV